MNRAPHLGPCRPDKLAQGQWSAFRMLQSSISRLSGSVARPKARQRCSLAGNSSVAQRVRQRNATRVCRASGSPTDPPPPADDSSSSNPASSSPASGESAEPSTSYLLPWEDEQPKQLPANYEAIKASILQMDNNQLQTALAVAIAAEDYALASRIKERLQQKLAESGSAVVSKPMDWAALGVPEWLTDRAERLGFLFPTEVQRRSTPVILSGADTVIASETGSGKTAACLVPALSQLDYPPQLFPEDLEGPQLLLLVPSFELGVQACLLLFKLWGGNISSRTPGDPANMFSYTGPAGIKVRGVLNDEEVQMAVAGRYLQGVHALVATPDMALALLSLPDSPLSFQDLRVIVVDEMDALLDAYPASFGQLMDAAVHRAAPSSSSSGGADADAAAAAAAAASGDPSGQSGTAQDNMAKLKALLERQQQQEQEKQQRAAGDAAAAAAAAAGSASMAAAAASEVDAQRAAEPLRAALWGDHMLSVLLPSTGAEPIKALHAFRDRVASLLLATPSAARGLDLPAVSHVYSLGLPPDATDYVHRAGRAGRIGSTAGGEICTVVTREELPALQRMVEEELGLQLECVDLERQGLGLLGSEYDAARQGLLQEGEEEQDVARCISSAVGTVVTREELPALHRMVEEELGLQLECMDLERQGLGLLGSEYDVARQGLLQDGEEQGEEQQQQQQGQQQQGIEEKQLENARKGLEDLFNLL
ncbi:hypothetical protein OEZ85_000580 [Tetradesmus obliquus]|uniref:RNA helicase n=1 Tax=Tetradesmus obliquus TaxID=3088 RepID=A0ABY8UJ89_TETOB|nr:hypothetical protein OEZ85_000580 [Tetradesmus obliquus]